MCDIESRMKSTLKPGLRFSIVFPLFHFGSDSIPEEAIQMKAFSTRNHNPPQSISETEQATPNVKCYMFL